MQYWRSTLVVLYACNRRPTHLIILLCAVGLLVVSPRIVLQAAWVAGAAKTSLSLSYEVGTQAYACYDCCMLQDWKFAGLLLTLEPRSMRM